MPKRQTDFAIGKAEARTRDLVRKVYFSLSTKDCYSGSCLDY